MRPRCSCNRCEIGKPWTVGQCRRCWLYHNNPKYRTYWDGGPDIPRKPNVTPQGPGTELKKLLAGIGISPRGGCGCEDKARAMDRLGVTGCKERRAEIIGWLQGQQAKLGWAKKLTIGVKMLAAGASITDPIGWLVDEAIRRAES